MSDLQSIIDALQGYGNEEAQTLQEQQSKRMYDPNNLSSSYKQAASGIPAGMPGNPSDTEITGKAQRTYDLQRQQDPYAVIGRALGMSHSEGKDMSQPKERDPVSQLLMGLGLIKDDEQYQGPVPYQSPYSGR